MADSKKKSQEKSRSPLILDSGAVIALARADHRTRAFVRRALEAGTEMMIPSVVIAETIRGSGPRDAPINRVLATARAVLSAGEATGRIAGSILGRSRSNKTIDAMIIAGASELGGGRILTSDAKDLQFLTQGMKNIKIHSL
ncbi:MAG: PIN domain-containing protein [Actinomycetota bacterium]